MSTKPNPKKARFTLCAVCCSLLIISISACGNSAADSNSSPAGTPYSSEDMSTSDSPTPDSDTSTQSETPTASIPDADAVLTDRDGWQYEVSWVNPVITTSIDTTSSNPGEALISADFDYDFIITGKTEGKTGGCLQPWGWRPVYPSDQFEILDALEETNTGGGSSFSHRIAIGNKDYTDGDPFLVGNALECIPGGSMDDPSHLSDHFHTSYQFVVKEQDAGNISKVLQSPAGWIGNFRGGSGNDLASANPASPVVGGEYNDDDANVVVSNSLR